MPKVLEINGFRFSFYSNENYEPPHIHITKGKGNAKYWLEPEIVEEYAYGFKLKERRDIKNHIHEHYESMLKKWYEHFNQ
jgi:hypothetical protein